MRDDWISPWWQAVLLPEKWDVCGLIVPSLSVWHTYALEMTGNRYLCGGHPDMDDAASLLVIASRNMRQGKRLFYSDRAKDKASTRVFNRLRKMTPEIVDEHCSEYVKSCTRHGHRISEGGGTPSGSPEQWALVENLTAHGWSINKAWDEQYGVARAMLDVRDERSGATVMTPHSYGEHMHDHWSDYTAMTGHQKVVLN